MEERHEPGCPVDVLEVGVVKALNSVVGETRLLFKPEPLGTLTCCVWRMDRILCVIA